VWPGIWLGSFLVQFLAYALTGLTSAWALHTSLAIPASIGLVAATQALVGAWLVRHSRGFPSPLDRGSEIDRLLDWAGPSVSLINATWGHTLFVSDVVPWPGVRFQWWTLVGRGHAGGATSSPPSC